MLALEERGGHVLVPRVDSDPLMRVLRRAVMPRIGGQETRIGSLPNRFTASVPEGLDGAVCAAAISLAWDAIAGAVWRRLSTSAGSDVLTVKTREIWDRQVPGVWECSWVLGENGALLDERKNVRRLFPADEPGFKCTQCGDREVLRGDGIDYREVSAWWGSLALGYRKYNVQQSGSERLCAICVVKRVFPLVAADALGWTVSTNYPSTPYLAAIDWLRRVLAEADQNHRTARALEEFLGLAAKAGVAQDERATRIASLSDGLRGHPGWIRLADLDGDALFEETVRSPTDLMLEDETQREPLGRALRELIAAVGAAPTPFYALLLMDGDSMGSLLSTFAARQTDISGAIARFTRAVPELVERHDGVVVYAGGDDVFALLPLDTALRCALTLRRKYVAEFAESGIQATISASVVYAQIHTPLRVAVRDAHRLLDDVAKDGVGRDAFAVRVWKRGGPILMFAKPWTSGGADDRNIDWVEEVESLKEDFKTDYASRFFYRLRDLFALLDPADAPSVLDDAEALELLVAEYVKSREQDVAVDIARERVRRLRDLCREEWREEGGVCRGRIRADGAFLIRFLYQKEV
jgi:CRISPR-associated protein Cmr2